MTYVIMRQRKVKASGVPKWTYVEDLPLKGVSNYHPVNQALRKWVEQHGMDNTTYQVFEAVGPKLHVYIQNIKAVEEVN